MHVRLSYLKKLIYLLKNDRKHLFNIILFRAELCIYLPLFLPFLYLNRIIPVDKRIHFANFRSERIGHFAIGFYNRYTKIKLGKYKRNCIYCFSNKISNRFLANKIKKIFFVNRLIRYMINICEILPYLDCLIDREPLLAARDSEGLTQKNILPELFNTSEIIFCSEWLRSYGWKGESQKIICLHVRDSAFLKKDSENNIVKIDWDYHSYRDADIDDFNEVILWLIKEGYFVIRTGKFSNKRVAIDSSSLIDYPFCSNQNDLIDVWLFANSDLVITTGSGIDEIATVYNVPKIYVNFLPLALSQSWTKSLTIPKHLYWRKDNSHLSFDEYIELMNILKTQEYYDLNLKIKDLSSNELLEVIKEGCDYFLKDKSLKKDDILITQRFKNFIYQKTELKSFHNWINKDWIISSKIFNKNLNFEKF